MKIYLPEERDVVYRKISERLRTPGDGGVRCPEFVALSRRLREEVCPGFADRPVILTGHQPIFYHPGILIKDLLACELARGLDGIALNMVVDTDEAAISFDYPAPGKSAERPVVEKRSILLNRPGKALRHQALQPDRREEFLKKLAEDASDAAAVIAPFAPFAPGTSASGTSASSAPAHDVSRYLRALGEIVSEAVDVATPGTRLRELWEAEHLLAIKTVRASDIVRSEAFLHFQKQIVNNGDEFRACYNRALEEYRRRHGIKNAAQPLPNLNAVKRELPFWIVRDGCRLPFTETADLVLTDEIYPRAAALTLFCRLFLCDLFIHGRGGARYDEITDRVLESFFRCKGAPFTVASATLELAPRPDYPIESRDLEDIIRDIRAVQFDPTKFLDEDHELRILWKKTVALFDLPGADRRAVHLKIQEINARTRELLGNLQEELQDEKRLAEAVKRNRTVFFDRGFPFIFYDLRPLQEAVRAYGNGAKF